MAEKPFKCSTCEKTFSDLSNCKKHSKICKNKQVITQASYLCVICRRAENTLEAAINHRKKFHEMRYSFECKKCNSKYTNFQHLVQHFDFKHSISVKKIWDDTGCKPGFYQCKICQKGFLTFVHLRNHWTKTHERKCDRCKNNYVDYENEDRREKIRKCNYCEKTFATFLKLRQHLEESHLMKYECDLCQVIPRFWWSYQD